MMSCHPSNRVQWLAYIFIFCTMLIQIWNYNGLAISHSTAINRMRSPEVVSVLNPSANISMPINYRRNDVNLRIIVITYNRPSSMKRLLNSLNNAYYLGDKVAIEIWIDRSKSGLIHEPTFSAAKQFIFKHGIIGVFNHSTHAGIYGQWMGVWQPSSESTEIAVILEDDLTVSPYFYRYLKNVHRKYDRMNDINGYALQCSMKHGGESGNLQAPYEHIVFKYPILGTWGFSPSKHNWLNFTKWYKSKSLKKGFYPLVPGILPTKWYMERMKLGKLDVMWDMWHIYYAWSNGENTIYPNLPNCESFSIKWGTIKLDNTVKQHVIDHLVYKWNTRIDDLPDNPIELDTHGKAI